MRAMEIYRNGTLAGRLTEENRQHFVAWVDRLINSRSRLETVQTD